jgi:hypothetical protein
MEWTVFTNLPRGRPGACRKSPSPAGAVIWAISLILAGLLPAGCRCGKETAQRQAGAEQPTPEAPPTQAVRQPRQQVDFPLKPGEEISLFDGQTLGRWTVTDFGGQGEVHIKDEAICLEMGNYATGITWSGPVVRMNYELTLDAMRVEGHDFFCGLTFPVGENPCSLILGGWGGSLCGLSSIDYFDASENETTRMVRFENGTWHHVRLRVVPNRIRAWLDDESLVDLDITGRKIGIRLEMDLCQPLGIATWATTGAVRNIRLKKLPEEIQ